METSLFKNIKTGVLLALIFIFPLFFLPLTAEFFNTNKMYLLAFASLALVLISIFEFIFTREWRWESYRLDSAILLFVCAHIASLFITSPNKWQALVNPGVGVVTMLSLVVLYYYLSRNVAQVVSKLDLTLNIATIVLLIVSTLYLFINANSLSLPSNLSFLKNQSFSPIGSQLDLFLFFIFVMLYNGARTFFAYPHEKREEISYTLNWIGLVIGFTGIIVVGATIFKLTNNLNNLLLPPFRISWYAAIEVLKNPLTALFGVGVDNYPAIFTRVKDALYNTTQLWQVSAFGVARNVPLHVFAETGLLGFIAYILLFFTAFKTVWSNKEIPKQAQIIMLIILGLSLLFPPSIVMYFVLFISLSLITVLDNIHGHENSVRYDLSIFLPAYIIMTLIGFILVAASGYWLTQTYAAEYHYRNAILGTNGVIQNNPYTELRKAISLNDRIEKYRIDFSRINMLIANNLAQKKPEEITQENRQTIAQAIQASIQEAKSAVALNPQKAGNWENLANIYRNILNVAQGADAWTVSAYQRAILADPQNPSYRLSLGGVFYSLHNYDEALNLFQQSVALKPDWSNAYYNLAWAAYQKGDYQRAAVAMENVLTLLQKEKNSADYKKAKKELDEFKKKIPVETEATPSAESQLRLPNQNNTATLEPKLKLPKEVEPDITISPTQAPEAIPTVENTGTPTP